MCQKLQFVTKETKPGIMFKYLLKLLTDFPAHQHRANWQNSQFKSLLDNLLIDHAACVHDFSESYRCSDQREIQSSYFQKNGSKHPCDNLCRHSILEKDGIDSSPEIPKLIREQFFLSLVTTRNMTEVLRNTAKSKYLTISNQYLRMLHVCTNGRMVVLLSMKADSAWEMSVTIPLVTKLLYATVTKLLTRKDHKMQPVVF